MLIRVAVFEIVSGYGGVGLSLGLPYVSFLGRSNLSLMVALRRIILPPEHGPLSQKSS